MKVLTLTVILGLPLLALGQQGEPQQSQEQTKDTQTTAPAKTKKMRPEQEHPANRKLNLRRAQTCMERRTFRVALRR